MASRSALTRRRQRWLDYPVQAAFLWLLYWVFRLLPLDWASGLGGWIGRTLGPRMGASRKALQNIERAMPDLGPERRREILADMWENLGRVVAEYPHIKRIWSAGSDGRIEVVGAEHLVAAAESRRSAIVFSGHLGNWELLSPAGDRYGLSMALVYRRPNNPLVARLLDRARGVVGGEHVPKGREGARAVMQAIKEGRSIGLLVDQKMNDGVAVPFFGRDAMTAPAVAQLSIRYRVPLLPARIVRVKGARFRMDVMPPLLPAQDRSEEAVRALLLEVNGYLERWIRELPAQWLWLHRRWPD